MRIRKTIATTLMAVGIFALWPAARAADPSPNAGYPNANTADGDDALFSLTTGSWNTATGPSPEFEASSQVAVHVTRADPQAALQFPNANEITTQVEPFSPAPATRSSFMASWNSTTGANGYLLDVSTSPSFDSYLEGYHDLDVRNVTGSVVTGLNPGTTYYYRVRAYNGTGIGDYSDVTTDITVPTTGFTIHATFDSSITGNPNAAAIEAMINRAISIYESRFSDPITIQILFRYATTFPDGTPMPAGALAMSLAGRYIGPWSSFINALKADGRTSNDFHANMTLPGGPLYHSRPNGSASEIRSTPRLSLSGRTS